MEAKFEMMESLMEVIKDRWMYHQNTEKKLQAILMQDDSDNAELHANLVISNMKRDEDMDQAINTMVNAYYRARFFEFLFFFFIYFYFIFFLVL